MTEHVAGDKIRYTGCKIESNLSCLVVSSKYFFYFFSPHSDRVPGTYPGEERFKINATEKVLWKRKYSLDSLT